MDIQDYKNSKKNKLYMEIERLKKELNDMLVNKNYIVDSEVVQLSKEIDELLNIYLKDSELIDSEFIDRIDRSNNK